MDTLDFYGFLERLTPAQFSELRQCKLDIAVNVWRGKIRSFKIEDRIIKDVNNMAREAKNAKDKTAIPNRDKPSSSRATTWVEFDIRSREHKERIKSMAADVDTILDTVVMLVDEGYDLVLKRGDQGSTVRAMLFCNVVDHPHYSHGLSAAAPDAWLALSTLVYKHTIGLEGTWVSKDEPEQDNSWR